VIGHLLAAAKLLHALHDAVIAFVVAWDDTPCEHDHDGDGDPDTPDRLTFHMDGAALHALLEDAGVEARNGCLPHEAADTVMAHLELKHTETGWDA
jgi:hypothetical protein